MFILFEHFTYLYLMHNRSRWPGFTVYVTNINLESWRRGQNSEG